MWHSVLHNNNNDGCHMTHGQDVFIDPIHNTIIVNHQTKKSLAKWLVWHALMTLHKI